MLPFDEESDAEAELAPSAPSAGDAPAELQRAFWALVVVFNVALLAGSLGAMLLAFRGDLSLGGSLLVLGLGLGFYGWRRYRTVTDRDWEEEGEAGDGETTTDAADETLEGTGKGEREGEGEGA